MSVNLIEQWHERARPKPTDKDFNVQLGCHFEEIGEMLEELGGTDYYAELLRTKALVAVQSLAEAMKAGEAALAVTNRKGMLDALTDQIVTAVGVGHCAKMNITEAVRRVNTSNWSKYDADGQPILDANGKIAKGPNYEPPNLEGLY